MNVCGLLRFDREDRAQVLPVWGASQTSVEAALAPVREQIATAAIFVREQIEQLLGRLQPRVVVGSAAAGADLLVLGAALGVGACAHVLLAGSRVDFRQGRLRTRATRGGGASMHTSSSRT